MNPPSRKKCNHCNFENPPDAKVCVNCGDVVPYAGFRRTWTEGDDD